MHKKTCCNIYEVSEYTERENDEKGPCKHKAKHISNIKVIRIYGERELRKGHACMQNMVGVRNLW